MRASGNSSKRKEIQCQPDCAERKGSIEKEPVIKQMEMNEKRYGPRAKGMALRITVLGNGRGMLGWLVVRNKPGDYSIADGNDMPVNTEQMKRRSRNK